MISFQNNELKQFACNREVSSFTIHMLPMLIQTSFTILEEQTFMLKMEMKCSTLFSTTLSFAHGELVFMIILKEDAASLEHRKSKHYVPLYLTQYLTNDPETPKPILL